MLNITPHVCRHIYCSKMAKSDINPPKTLQYLMGHSNIGVALNTYTYLGLEDAVDELKRVEELENTRKEMEKINGEGTVSQKMFRAFCKMGHKAQLIFHKQVEKRIASIR